MFHTPRFFSLVYCMLGKSDSSVWRTLTSYHWGSEQCVDFVLALFWAVNFLSSSKAARPAERKLTQSAENYWSVMTNPKTMFLLNCALAGLKTNAIHSANGRPDQNQSRAGPLGFPALSVTWVQSKLSLCFKNVCERLKHSIFRSDAIIALRFTNWMLGSGFICVIRYFKSFEIIKFVNILFKLVPRAFSHIWGAGRARERPWELGCIFFFYNYYFIYCQFQLGSLDLLPRELYAKEESRDLAVTTFQENRSFYHPIAAAQIAKDLGLE